MKSVMHINNSVATEKNATPDFATASLKTAAVLDHALPNNTFNITTILSSKT
jgi:hypothetical protein